jgi:hypothetical protein
VGSGLLYSRWQASAGQMSETNKVSLDFAGYWHPFSSVPFSWHIALSGVAVSLVIRLPSSALIAPVYCFPPQGPCTSAVTL